MKFIDNCAERSNRRGEKDIGEVIEFTVADARYYGCSQNDATEYKLNKLISIVAAMSKHLTDDQQKELVTEIGSGWDVVE